MDVNRLLKFAELDRPRNVFDQIEDRIQQATLRNLGLSNAFDLMHAEAVKSLTNSRAVTFHDELIRTRTIGYESAIETNWRRHIDGLNESVLLRVLREPVFGNLRESSLLTAQSAIEQNWQQKLSELTTGISNRSAAQISDEFLSRIKADTLPKFHSYIEVETERLRRSIGVLAGFSSASSFAALTATIDANSFVTAAKLMQGVDTGPQLMKRIFEPSVAYGQFAARTIEQLTNPISESRRAALAGSLLLADTQAIRTNSLLTALGAHLTRPSEIEPTPIVVLPRPVINRYRLQREELISQEEGVPEDADYETLVELAPSAGLFDSARRCMELIGLCDEANQTCAGETIFKLTPMFILSFAGLLGTVAQNRVTLARVVEALYIVLYEAAGKDKLRYLERNYLTREECEIVWKIKHLRNKWLSHDAEHGSDRDIRESRRLRLEALKWLGVERIPTQRNEYARLHGLLLEKVHEFLTLLLTRIVRAT